jgi:hypothetical protein
MPEHPSASETRGSTADVHRYAEQLVWEARQEGGRRLREAHRLAAVVKLLDPEAADDLVRTVEAANRGDLGMAEQHAREVIELSRPHPADEEAEAPAPRRRRQGPEDHLNSILRKVSAMVETAERGARGHFEAASHLAGLLQEADPAAAERVLTAARATSSSQVTEARLAAEEISSAARVRSRALVESFGRMLATEAELGLARRSPRAQRLLAGLERFDAAVAARIQTAVTAAESARLDSARRKSQEVAERAHVMAAVGAFRQD